MGTPAEALESRLDNFETAHPVAGSRLRAIVTESPELSALLKEAISKGNLDGGFQPLSSALRAQGVQGSYAATRGVLSVPMDRLTSALPQDANTLLANLGHEATHAINNEANQESNARFTSAAFDVATAPPPRDYTLVLKAHLEERRDREAGAEIGGVNVLAAKIQRENPGATSAQLYEKLYQSSSEVHNYFNLSGEEPNVTHTPKSGITFNGRFQIEPTPQNVEAFGQHSFDARGYPAIIGQRLMDQVARADAMAQLADPDRIAVSPKIDLSALGLDVNNIRLPNGMLDGTPPRLNDPVPRPLSSVSEALLKDCEHHVRHTAEKHGRPWDTGMDNTVSAMARSAREAGMTGITHFKANGSTLSLAQHDGYSLKEASLDANIAANTPAAHSRAQMEAMDQLAPTHSHSHSQAVPQRNLDPEPTVAR